MIQQQNDPKKENTRWIDTLSPSQHDKIHQFIMAAWGQVDGLLKEIEKRRPESKKQGEGSHLDAFIKAEALAMFLNALRQGKTPPEALKLAKEEGSSCFKRWNEICKKDIYVQRWNEEANSLINDMYKNLTRLLELP